MRAGDPRFRSCLRRTPGAALDAAHRVGALIVAAAIFATSGHAWFHHRSRFCDENSSRSRVPGILIQKLNRSGLRA